jgi:hypothetical protein
MTTQRVPDNTKRGLTLFRKTGTVASQQPPKFPANSKKNIDPTPTAVHGGGRFTNVGQKNFEIIVLILIHNRQYFYK